MSLDAANKVSEDFRNFLKKIDWDTILILYLCGFVFIGCSWFVLRFLEVLVALV